MAQATISLLCFFFFHISKTREVDVYLKRSIMYTGMND